ncbi:MAG: EamA family transporter [Candidatus Methylomirabilis sp.]
MTDQLTALLLAFIAALCIDIGLVLLKVRGDKVADRAGGRLRSLFGGYANDPLWLLGLFFQPLGYGFYLWALELAPLNIVQTTMSSGVTIFVLFAVCFLGERLDRLEWVAIGAVVLGMMLLGVSLSPYAESSRSLLDPRVVLNLSLILVGLSVIAWFTLATSGKPHGRRVALGVASGLLLGLASIYAKGLALVLAQSPPGQLLRHAITTPYAALTLCANMVGFFLLLGAFRGGRASIVLALSATLSNVVPIVSGMIALGEQLPSDPWLATSRLLAFLLTLGGAALLGVRLNPSAAGHCEDPERVEGDEEI